MLRYCASERIPYRQRLTIAFKNSTRIVSLTTVSDTEVNRPLADPFADPLADPFADATFCRTLWYAPNDMAIERTYAMVKPDGVKRGLVGEVVSRLENRGFKIVGMKLMQISREVAETHYGEHKGKPFFDDLVSFITSSPVVAMVVEGENAIAEWRKMMGATNPKDAAPGTLRGDFASTIDENVVHGSDAPATAEREIGIFFEEQEMLP